MRITIFWLGVFCTSLALHVTSTAGEDANANSLDAAQRRHLQERNRDALVKLQSLLTEHLSQSPATSTPYPPRARRRRLNSRARPIYSTQCLYEVPPLYPDLKQPFLLPDEDAQSEEQPQPQDPAEDGMSTVRRRQAQQEGAETNPGVCYLNPAVVAHPDMPEAETPIEIMLLKAAWSAYQCSFENRKGRCGTYRHPPYECRWQEDQGRCAVSSEYLLPRLLTLLHCRDDATITPFWDRCYTIGVLTDDNDWCGQSDGNDARCWWFEARNDSEVDLCAPSPGGGVESRDKYDELVAQMRSGVWLPEWFGSCPTAELVYTIKSACNYTTPDDCRADPSCAAREDLPQEYGMCRLRDELIWDAIFGAGSALFNATAAAMAECAAASRSLEACTAAGSLARDDRGDVRLDASKFGDVIDLVFIEEVTPGAAGPGARVAVWRTWLMAVVGAVLLAALRPLDGEGR